MFHLVDDKKDVAVRILADVCGLPATELVPYPNGYCHSVYRVQTGHHSYVLRVTGTDAEPYYRGALHWLPQLSALGIPVPQILQHGSFEDVFYTLITFLPGTDIGNIYHTLDVAQKRVLARDMATIQQKVSTLPAGSLYGYTADGALYQTWSDFLDSQIARAAARIKQNGIGSSDICEKLQ